MPLEANVICIGQFSKDIICCLDYEEEAYASMSDGTGVAATFFYCVTGDQSRRLAQAVGADASDFNTHMINKDKIDWDALQQMCDSELGGGIESFKLLIEEKNFICMYLPNK